jgi:hypothetical protein
MRSRTRLLAAPVAAGLLMVAAPALAESSEDMTDHSDMVTTTSAPEETTTTTEALETSTTVTTIGEPDPSTTTTVQIPDPTTTTTEDPHKAPPGVTASYSPTSGPLGTTVKAKGSGCIVDGYPGVGVALIVHPDEYHPGVGEGVMADAKGNWSVAFPVLDLPQGTHPLYLACVSQVDPENNGFLYDESDSFTVTKGSIPPTDPPSTPPSLPGDDSRAPVVTATPDFTG